MPDKTKKTISASQAAALFGVSPYITRRALFDHFHDNVDIESDENRRMDFGKYVQPYICRRTSDEFNLEVIENEEDKYVRHKQAPFGCTTDAHLKCPTRGRGVVEAKSISYQVFRETWTDRKAPLHIEIQVQEQLLVTGADWAVIAVMIGADEDFRWFERKPDREVFKRLLAEGKQFFEDIKKHRRPPVTGHPIELRGLEALFPVTKNGVVYDAPKDDKTGDLLRRYEYHRAERLFHKKNEDELKIKILDVAKDASEMRCYGANARISKTPMTAQTIRKEEHLRTSIRVEVHDDVEPLPDVGGFAIEA